MPDTTPARVAQHDVQITDLARRIGDLEDAMYGNGRPGLKDELAGLRADARKAHSNAALDMKWIAALSAVLAAVISGGFRLIEVLITKS